MSGFGVRDGRIVWDVLDSQVCRWHANGDCTNDDGASCWTDSEGILAEHAVPAGFTVNTYRSGRKRIEYLYLEGPGIAEGTTDRLYEAITGRPGRIGQQVDPTELLARAAAAAGNAAR